ncbi:MAG: hypothetical protein E7255_10690 [Lachnospiraceae bacterium]|nr:hypothetical protein [Lachnospiraceae bacterium]
MRNTGFDKGSRRLNPPVKNRKFNSRMQARLLLVFCVISLLLFGLMGRLVYLVQQDGDRYAKSVLSRQSYVSAVLPYQRGDILDRNGTVLARSELQFRLILDPMQLLLNPDCVDLTIAALEECFDLSAEELSSILKERPNSRYVILQKNLNYDMVEGFEKLADEKKEKDKSVTGVWFEKEYVRTYPYDTLACDILGFTSADNTGYYGIEEYYNEELNGTNGREYGYYDATLNIERIVKKAENGNSIVSTIDANAQRIIQKHINEFNAEFGSKNIGVLLMNPNNGEIIAMASSIEYDLNDPRNLEGIKTKSELAAMTDEEKMTALNELWKNDIISNGFEPGSTFKPITIAAAMEEAYATKNSTYICDGGESVGGRWVKCSRTAGHGKITLEEALMYSCNDALMQIADAEGRHVFYQYQKRFGLGQKTGIDLPGEEAGILIPEKNLNAMELATSGFGQSLNVTMLQLAAAYASLVNGGYYYQPHIVRQIINDNGATVKRFDKTLVRQTVSEETSKFIQQAMYRTVEEGTAKGAKVPGYAVGGKTGTAQKLPREAKTYIVSFLGAVPAINPEVVVYVAVDEPQNVERQANSAIATTLASRIMTEVLPAIGIYPEGEIDYLLPEEDTEEAADKKEEKKSKTDDTDKKNKNKNSDEAGAANTADPNSSGSSPGKKDAQKKQGEEDAAGSEEQEAAGENGEDSENGGNRIDLSDLPEDEFNADAIGPEDEVNTDANEPEDE